MKVPEMHVVYPEYNPSILTKHIYPLEFQSTTAVYCVLSLIFKGPFIEIPIVELRIKSD